MNNKIAIGCLIQWYEIELVEEDSEVWVLASLWGMEKRENDCTLDVVDCRKEGWKRVWNSNLNVGKSKEETT